MGLIDHIAQLRMLMATQEEDMDMEEDMSGVATTVTVGTSRGECRSDDNKDPSLSHPCYF